jgi:hypothetical protein
MKDNGTPEIFCNRKEALDWLQSKGQISRGKFYRDCLAGHVTIYPNKSLSKFQVAEYAEKVFGFARQQVPPKPIKKNYRNHRPEPEGLIDSEKD